MKLPLSGAEENFTEFVYGSNSFGKQHNNCYGFALDWFRGGGKQKLQPGQLSKTLKPDDDLTQPKVLKERVIADLATKKNGGYVVSPCVKCKEGYYKIMAFVDKNNDYHWYRQMGDMVIDTNGKNINTITKNMNVDKSQVDVLNTKALVKKAGLFAHKRGLADLTVLDASGKFITDPRTANRKYNGINYDTYVATFCVNARFGKGEKFSCV